MFHSIKDVLNSEKFQNQVPQKTKHIVRKVNREKERKDLQQKRKDDQKKGVA